MGSPIYGVGLCNFGVFSQKMMTGHIFFFVSFCCILGFGNPQSDTPNKDLPRCARFGFRLLLKNQKVTHHKNVLEIQKLIHEIKHRRDAHALVCHRWFKFDPQSDTSKKDFAALCTLCFLIVG